MKITFRALTTWASTGLACGLFLQPAAAHADEWERIKVIQPGRSVQVKLHSTRTVKGQMDAWRADGMTVRKGASIVSIERSEVAEVRLLIGRSRGRKAIFAGSITAGVVAGALGVIYAAGSDDCCADAPAAVVVPLAAGVWGGIAGGIAALFPQHKELIYSAAPPERGRR